MPSGPEVAVARFDAPDVFALATIRALAGEIDRTGGVP